jgi:7,8-dihydropterin-6-yl-methyl-4-(beta-D-ribofuranosyl)aminobenzene 5'-phosphate synthase
MGDCVTVLHDSFGLPGALSKNWGFAALVEFGGLRVLFDTGNDADVFCSNVESLDVDLSRIDFVVISHRHGDHTTGLEYVLSKAPRVPVFVPKETFGVFGSSLPGSFYPRCPTLPLERRYYDGFPPELIRHGTPWRGADFRPLSAKTEIAPGVVALHTVSDVAGTREMPELTLSLRAHGSQVLLTGCSHCGIERIVEAARDAGPPVHCIFGGLHLVLESVTEIERVALCLRDRMRVESIAPGHCTGEPAFEVLQRAFGERYRYAGLGTRLPIWAVAS